MKKTLKNDIALILALLVLAGAAWGVLRLTRRAGWEAVVTVDGETVAVLPLDADTSLVLQPGAGYPADSGWANTVVVEDGRVCVLYANCPDQVCVRKGWAAYDGESIVCLPHKLVVTVRGGTPGLDAVTGG